MHESRDKDHDVYAEDRWGQTPFHQVFSSELSYISEDCTSVAKLLVEHGADVNSREKGYETPLQLASFKQELESVRFLLLHGADVHAKNSRGQPLFHQMFKLEPR